MCISVDHSQAYAFDPSPFGRAGEFLFHSTGFVQSGFGSEGTTGVVSVRNCQKLPPCPTESMPAGSRVDPLLAEADPISNSGSCSLITLTYVGEVHEELQSTGSTQVILKFVEDCWL